MAPSSWCGGERSPSSRRCAREQALPFPEDHPRPLRLGAQYEVQYRLNFVLQLIQSGVRLVTAVIAIQIVFGYTSNLDGWGRSEPLAVLGVHILWWA